MADSKTTQGEKVQIVELRHLHPAPGAKTVKIRVGQGEGSKGKTTECGTEGMKTHYQVSASFESDQVPIHMCPPKPRGFKNPLRVEYQVVSVARPAELFPGNGKVTVEDLIAKHAARDDAPVKVLGFGELTVKPEIEVDA